MGVKKTTVEEQLREERERLEEQRREARKRREAELKRVEERRMEEAKHANADDSALGAYDVWGKGDYKGVDISKEVHVSVEDTAKRLAPPPTGDGDGAIGGTGKVSFRKRVKKKKGTGNRRTTSADDD